jgi:hypothetical protein
MLALAGSAAQAQTGLLNDTGQTTCYDASDNATACNTATVGNSGTRPHQDGRYGRDAAFAAGQFTKTGGGAAGFDFSCVLWNGTVVNNPSCTSTLVANTTGTASGTPGTDWACTKDNVTGLVWSLQTQGPVNWHIATAANYLNSGHNSVNRCGSSTSWRLPIRRELLNIVNRNRIYPTIDTTYFPATPNDFGYWSSDTFVGVNTHAWAVAFGEGQSLTFDKTTDLLGVRLVRSGQ